MDLDRLFQAFALSLNRPPASAEETGALFRDVMGALVEFDHIVVFAYRGKERPLDLYCTFDRDDYVVFVSLYQAGPFLLDPFYHAALDRKHGVFRMRQLAPDRFFASEYYRNYYVKTGLAEEVGFFLTLERDVSIVLSLMRRQERGPFPASGLQRCRRLRRWSTHLFPVIGQAFQRVSMRSRHTEPGDPRNEPATMKQSGADSG